MSEDAEYAFEYVFITRPGRISLLPRWIHHAFAFVFGFFWLPCPACGDPFGGHEWRDPLIQTHPQTHKGCCPRHRLVVWSLPSDAAVTTNDVTLDSCRENPTLGSA